MKVVTTKTPEGQVIWHDNEILSTADPAIFDLSLLQNQGAVTGRAMGRGRAHFLCLEGHNLVLRPFRRGGLVGKINADRYLRTGAGRSRAYQEYSLLQWMRAQGLPVPRPAAARYVPAGLWYRADLITLAIPQARPLADVLQDNALPEQTWFGIGAAICKMHVLGVDHTDLNCRNILLDNKDKAWLIDFDKCRRRDEGPWMQGNLARLKRSLEKELTKQPGLCWHAADWAALQDGYADAHP